MGERKVINKYYPVDFDPSLLVKRKRPKNDQQKVRIMMPMSIRCTSCGEYIYKGKKFNARKETVAGEEYLGIKIYRFYVRCTRCSSEITIKTDPKNADYTCEMGASRNFEQNKENERIVEDFKKKRAEEEQGDAMKALENKTMDSKMEMDILEGLDEIRTVNAIHQKISADQLLEHHLEQMRKDNEHSAMERTDIELEDEDEEVLDMLAQRERGEYVKRLEDEEQDEEERAHKRRKALIDTLGPVITVPKSDTASSEESAAGGFKAPLPRLPPKPAAPRPAVTRVLNKGVQIQVRARGEDKSDNKDNKSENKTDSKDKSDIQSAPIVVKGEGSSDDEDESGSSTGFSLVSY